MVPLLKIPVCLDRCDSYESHVLLPLLQAQLDFLAVPANLSGKKVLLKPNLISAKAPALACTNPFFVAAAASCFLSRGARVLLGDSPAFGSAARVLERHGFVTALRGMPVEYVSFKTLARKQLACGLTVGVAAEALDCDYFVNLPRIKAHEQMGVTMAVKNVFGIVLGARKAWLHMRHGQSHLGFAEMILDLLQFLPTSLALADGIEVMNERGPMSGSALFLGCVAASGNFVALDRALLAVLEIEKKRSPLAVAAAKLALPGACLQDLEFPHLHPLAFAGSGFRSPVVLNPIKFHPLRYLRSTWRRILLELQRKV
ncbi:MAG: DUF362 domain-containing protein [Proteobacteria bacterium]|nr:DUF362 domain-containing protein [Pseudomonadota bacterium]MBU1419054.1 DUF362 domain-containing protein [Pseudomonadota bacterium]MBU1456322.1 DUF362 domain-containing protein [Pseudomonadota bacterium]